jgi:hypothetical protein
MWLLLLIDYRSGKPVADGAVSFHIDHLVTSRVARATYGIEIYKHYNPGDPEDYARRHTQFTDAAGHRCIPNQFSSILMKVTKSNTFIHSVHADVLQGTQVSELREFRNPFYFVQKSRAACRTYSVKIISYKGALKEPRWLNVEQCLAFHRWSKLTLISSNSASFSTLCTIHADLSELSRTLLPQKSVLDRSDYYQVDFEVIILFGLTELKAQISWKHKVSASFSSTYFPADRIHCKGC